MKITVSHSRLKGIISVPGSKSHTIRGLVIAALCDGTSKLINPLLSSDTLSCIKGIQSLGAEINPDYEQKKYITITGFGTSPAPSKTTIDVGNSGTSLRLLAGVAALSDIEITFTGDNSIRTRPMKPLLNSLMDLGAVFSSENNFKCPFSINGPIKGGKTSIDGITSQFLSSLLICSPLAEKDTEIQVLNLHEKPYVQITLSWLKEQNISFEESNLEYFKVKGGQKYTPFTKTIPSDFSTACFPLCASLITRSPITIEGLDFSDTQGDKMVFEFMKKFGINITTQGTQTFLDPTKQELRGAVLDLNATPDALPALAAAACFVKGKTVLKNVAQARIKECDRISSMALELRKMGGKVEELEDGLIIEGADLTGAKLHGYHDHRIVMALSLAGMGAKGESEIDSAKSIEITYPGFISDFKALNANISIQ